ncbi:MAG: ABC transporter ATP-binding protein [Promethearchaeota archaeon]
MLKCEKIQFKYGTKLILDDISIQFKNGHLYGILGPNGSGKTTFIKILGGILKQNFGKVFINELDIKKLSIREMAKKLAIVNQSNTIEFDFTVSEIVRMGRFPHIGRFSRESAEDKKIINEILHQFNLYELKDRNFNQLSGGEQQKVIIARAIAQQSKIILLDEPTSYLDINYQLEFMERLKNYVDDGLIVVVVLHDVNLATQFCDKIILLNEGCIKAFGSPKEIITRDNIKSIYNIDVVVKRNLFTNSIYVIPLRKEVSYLLLNEKGIKRKKIHLVGGAGSALEILPKLRRYDVSVGVVNILDDDYILAHELGYKIISEAPFSPISEESTEKLKDLLKTIDLIILMNIPFGRSNLENLKVLNDIEKPIIVFEKDSIEERDYTDGMATIIYNKIKNKKNVRTVNNLQDLFNFD